MLQLHSNLYGQQEFMTVQFRAILAFSAITAISASFNSLAAQDVTAQVMISTDSGTFTAEQAEKGKNSFLNICASCHVPTEYSDNTFKGLWHGHNVFELFEKIRTTMPQDNPGGLERAEYVDIVAYILQLNGAPAGKVALPSDSAGLSLVRMDIKKQARPR